MLKGKEWEKIANTNQRQLEFYTNIRQNRLLRQNCYKRKEEYVTIKGSIHPADVTIINISVPKNRALET